MNTVTSNVKDVVFFGDDVWKLICKATGEGWMKSTKVMQVGTGVVVQVTTQQGDSIAEAVCYVPDVRIVDDVDESGAIIGRRLI